MQERTANGPRPGGAVHSGFPLSGKLRPWHTILLTFLLFSFFPAPNRASPSRDEAPRFVRADSLGRPPFSKIRIFVLTMDPGDEFYAAWGHTAMLVEDPRLNGPVVFNYGMFNFDSDFIFRYLFDVPMYMLGLNDWRQTLLALEYEQRTLYAQEILLNEETARALLDRLYRNSRPENREYEYHHLYDNCTTRVRDLVNLGLEGRLKESQENLISQRNYRELAMGMIREDPPYWAVLNIMLNSQGDMRINGWEAMFLPHTFLEGLEALHDKDAKEGREERVGPVLRVGPDFTKDRLEEKSRTWSAGPVTYGLGLLFYLILFHLFPALSMTKNSQIRKKSYDYPPESGPIRDGDAVRRLRKAGIILWSLAAGLPGLLIAALWFISPREIFAWNWNLLALNPLLLLHPLLLRYSRGIDDTERREKLLFRIHSFYLFFPLLGLFLDLTGIVRQFILPTVLFATAVHGANLFGHWRRYKQ